MAQSLSKKAFGISFFLIILIVMSASFASIYFFQQSVEKYELDLAKEKIVLETILFDNSINNSTLDIILPSNPIVAGVAILENDTTVYTYKNNSFQFFDEVFADVTVGEETYFLTQGNIFSSVLGVLYTFFSDTKPSEFLKGDRIDVVVQKEGSKTMVVAYSFDAAREILQNMIMLLMVAFGGALMAIILKSYWIFRKFIAPIQELKRGALRIAEGNLREPVNVSGSDEIGLVGIFFNEVSRNLKHIMEELVEKERMTDEIDVASRIQQQLLPLQSPNIPGLDIKANNKAAAKVGGDSFDYIPVDKDNTIMYIGDVSGHGIPAGLIMTMVDILIHGFVDIFKTDIRELLVNVNKHLQPKIDPAMFMTLLMLNWNHTEQKFTYVGCGHETIVHYQARTGKATEIKPGGIALGMIKDNSKLLKIGELSPEPGDVMVLYTDGVVEAWGGDYGAELYGNKRFVEVIQKYGGSSNAEFIFNAVTNDLSQHMQHHEQRDDITMMIIKYNGVKSNKKKKGITLSVDTFGLIEKKESWEWQEKK